MTKILDILFKFFAVLWLGMVGFVVVALSFFLASQEFIWEPALIVVGFVVGGVLAFIFSLHTWKFYFSDKSQEILLDDIEFEAGLTLQPEVKNFRTKSGLAIFVGLASLCFAFFVFEQMPFPDDYTWRVWLLIIGLVVLCFFGVLLIQRAIDVWLKCAVRNEITK
ncbi:MAG: hypothetical protein AB8B53_01745 [Flavobacteriales bacterium]